MLKKLLVAVLMFGVTLGVGAAEAVRVLRFGGHPVDPQRAAHLEPGECIIRTDGLQGPVGVMARVDGDLRLDHGMIPNGTEVVIGPDGQARYIAECGNDVVGDWRPLGASTHCAEDTEASNGRPTEQPALKLAYVAADPTMGATNRQADAQAVQRETEIRYVPVSSTFRNWRQKHPAAMGFIYAGIGAVTGAVLCHNTIFGICGHDDRQDTGNSNPVAPIEGPGDDQCKNGGCHDDDDDN